MVPENDFSAAFRPLETIQRLYQQDPNPNTFNRTVQDHFRSLFTQDENRSKIPALTRQNYSEFSQKDESGHDKQDKHLKLVRWRVMVQDTGLGTELFLASSPPSTSDGPRRCASYGAEPIVSPQQAASINPHSSETYSQLSERSCIYVVSVPGETKWASKAYNEGYHQENDEAESLTSAAKELNIQDQARIDPNPYESKIPIPEESHLGGMIKIYNLEEAESLQVGSVIEVVGVLDASSLPNVDWQQQESSSSSNNPSPSVPCVHALFLEKSSSSSSYQHEKLLGQLSHGITETSEETRSKLIKVLSKEVNNDELAAEFLLLSLISRIHTRKGPVTLGSFSLNLSNFSLTSSSSSSNQDATSSNLFKLLSSLLPTTISQSLSLSHLNDSKTRFSPKSNGENLSSGRFQLPKGTTILVDENSLNEGTLNENGTGNLKTLNNLLTNHKLEYQFPFSNFEFDSDLNFLIVSTGKSLLNADIHLPVMAPASNHDQAHKPREDSVISENDLQNFRHYLLKSKYSEFKIDEEISEFIQQHFVESRKKKSGKENETGQEDLLRQMSIARLLALSYGHSKLTQDLWLGAVELDLKRSRRLEK